MPNTNAKSLPLDHQEAVRRLDATITQIRQARQICHERLERAVLEQDAELVLEDAIASADAYGMDLEALFNTLIELRVLQPAAWEASEGGRAQRAMDAAFQEMVADSLALVFGIGWPGDDSHSSERGDA